MLCGAAAYHQNAPLCSTSSVLLTVTSAGGGGGRNKKRGVRTKQVMNLPSISQLTGDLLKSRVVENPAWAGLLRLKQSGDVMYVCLCSICG